MDDASATSLARRFRDGDRGSFDALVEGLARPLLAMAFRYTRDWDVARDLAQETWLKVHQRIRAYDPDRPFRPWLWALHRNACLSWLRGAARDRSRRIPGGGASDPAPASEPADSAPGPDILVERRELGTLIREAAAALPARQREVFLQVDLEQGDQRAVAEELGMNFTTLRTTLRLARRKVAAVVRDAEEIP